MSKVRIISDLHLGHKKILQFSPQRGGTTIEEQDEPFLLMEKIREQYPEAVLLSWGAEDATV